MTQAAAPLAVDVLTGSAAPPSANGELVFASPHEARLFGMAHSLVQTGLFDWDTFRAALITAIAAAEIAVTEMAVTEMAAAEIAATETVAVAAGRVAPAGGWAPAYYGCFALTLERLLAERNLIPLDELLARTHALAARPPGHDHEHDHTHDEETPAETGRGG